MIKMPFLGKTISTNLLGNLRTLYQQGLNDLVRKVGVRYGVNGYTSWAPPAYIIAVAAVEAFVNETLLSQGTRIVFRDSPLWNLPNDFLENLNIRHKLIIIPYYLFGKTFQCGQQPLQEFELLIKVRNYFVHYKMGEYEKKFIKALEQRGIILKASHSPEGGDYPTPDKLSCTEGIRWAHNTICKIVTGLAELAPNNEKKAHIFGLASSFSELPSSYPRECLKAAGIDPDSNHPEHLRRKAKPGGK